MGVIVQRSSYIPNLLDGGGGFSHKKSFQIQDIFSNKTCLSFAQILPDVNPLSRN